MIIISKKKDCDSTTTRILWNPQRATVKGNPKKTFQTFKQIPIKFSFYTLFWWPECDTSASNQTPHSHIAFSLLKKVKKHPKQPHQRDPIPQMEGSTTFKINTLKWTDGYILMNEKELRIKRTAWMTTPQQPSLASWAHLFVAFELSVSFYCRPELFLSCFFLLITQEHRLGSTITTSNSHTLFWMLMTGILNEQQSNPFWVINKHIHSSHH